MSSVSDHGHNGHNGDPRRKSAGRSPKGRDPVQIGADDLPLHCPMPGRSLWDSHPRVYVPIEPGAEARCPYCGTLYRLGDD